MKCKRILTIATLLLTLIFTGCKKEPTLFNGNDFRVGNWGDPLYLIEKNESSMITYEGVSRLVYWDQFLGYDANVSYIFYESKLSQGYFEIESDQQTDAVYATVISKLSEMYGAPKVINENSSEFQTDRGFIYVSKAGINCTVLMGK